MFTTQILWCFLLATLNNPYENVLIIQQVIITEIILNKNEEIPEICYRDMTYRDMTDETTSEHGITFYPAVPVNHYLYPFPLDEEDDDAISLIRDFE